MSRVSQGSINDIAYLYEEINIQQNDFLNEESEYYDAELTEFVADILSTISSSMVCEGYSAEGIFSFLETSSDETIIEKYLNFDEFILTESVVEDRYIEEQLYLFDSTILEFLGALGRGAINLIGRVASKPARMAVAKKLMTSKNPTRTAAAVDRWARMKLGKSGFNPNLVSKAGDISMKTKMGKLAPALGKIRDIAKGAKGFAKGALLAGTGVLTGYLGAKMGGAGEVKPSGTQRSDQPSTPPKDDFLKGSALAKLGGREGRIKGGEFRTMSWSPESRARYNAASKRDAKPPVTPPAAPGGGSGTPSGGGGGGGGTPSGGAGGAGGAGRSTSQTRTPQPSGQTGDKEKDMETWAKKYPQLAAKVKPGQAGYEVSSRLRDNPSASEKQDQTPTQGSSTAQVDPSSVQADIEAEKERLRKRAEQQRNTTTPTTTTTKESYEPYDIILEYLIGRGHADTINEANYIMMEMDQNAIGIIMQEYNDYLLAEEVSEWVDGLLEEGYDLSDYTWDDIVEYYVNEGFKPTGYHHDYDPYRFRGGNQSNATSPRGRRIQNRVKELEASGDQEKADRIHNAASDRHNQERGIAKQKRNNKRGPGPRRARADAMRDMRDSGFAEEIQEWVNDLVEEGYDLSQYTWDDMVEYYVTEANRAERELGMNPRQREISRNLRYKNYYVKPSKRRPDSDFYNPENLKPKPKNTYSGDESDSWHDSMSQARRVRSKVNKNKT